MSQSPNRAPGASDPGLAFRPFVALMAGLMAMNALAIDVMISALPNIAHSLHVAHENQWQWIIATYVIGFGAAQLVWGPLADRYGRKPILVASTALFGVLSLVAGVSKTFPLLLAARFFQGVAASSSRVLVVSIVRDCYEGRQMARVMSLSFMCFLAVPILAPSIGQIIMLTTGSWRWIFLLLGGYGGLVAIIAGVKLKETLHPEFRRPVSIGGVVSAAKRVLGNRTAAGYTLCSSMAFGSMMGFINSVAQIFGDIFHAPQLFPLIFACIGGTMALSSLLNSRLVERLGTRRISQMAMFGFASVSLIHLATALAGMETIWTFGIAQAATMFFFGMMGSNFGSMAMETVGDIAGTASSIQGFLQMIIGALIGLAIGQSFNGTTVPLAAGFSLIGIAVIVGVTITERGRLFQAHHAPVAP